MGPPCLVKRAKSFEVHLTWDLAAGELADENVPFVRVYQRLA